MYWSLSQFCHRHLFVSRRFKIIVPEFKKEHEAFDIQKKCNGQDNTLQANLNFFNSNTYQVQD